MTAFRRAPRCLPSPTHVTQPFLGKTPPTNVVAPIPSSGSGSQITRSNSIPANDMGYELYGTSPLSSSLSKSMMRSGSFREPSEDVHGSVLSLASNASSNYSSDSELVDLKETIEVLTSKNTEAQSIIQVALNVPDTTPKELQIDRQNSSESISSLNSITSHSSAGSLKEQEAKKKKKKSWLRSSFNKAFSKKGSKAPYADIEEIATPVTSAPSSPKIHHNVDNASSKASTSTSGSCEGHEDTEHEEKVVSELRSELWEKERKLTDIRLEALSSAHQLEQLQEAMTNMQEVKQLEFFIGTVKISGRTDWFALDSAVIQAFKEYLAVVDPSSSLALSQDSIYSYSLSHLKRVLGAQPPETPPVRLYSKGSSCISVTLKGTTNQPVKMTPNHGLHLSFRMVMFSNNVEPANGFLVRYLHRKLMEAEDPRSMKNEDLLRVLDWVPRLWYHLHTFLEKHCTSDFLIGPCFFLSCPVTVEEFRTWFIDLWNHSIIPYLQEGAKDGIKMAMLLKLQEAANYIESPEKETDPRLPPL
ncbi:hypothetical protein cypCar_00037839 [Cyprinus carpio]|nr:hypothetical protein cypCar_00037839 [Cyprinus carpio]